MKNKVGQINHEEHDRDSELKVNYTNQKDATNELRASIETDREKN